MELVDDEIVERVGDELVVSRQAEPQRYILFKFSADERSGPRGGIASCFETADLLDILAAERDDADGLRDGLRMAFALAFIRGLIGSRRTYLLFACAHRNLKKILIPGTTAEDTMAEALRKGQGN